MKLVSLKEVCEVFGDGDWIESKDQSVSGIRLIQTGNVGVGVFKDRIEKARWISEETFKKLRCTEIREGDVLISRLPDPVGRSCLIPALSHKAITAVDCSIVRFDSDKMNAKFFIYYSQSSQYANSIDPLISGSTRQRISREKLGTIKIPLPSLEEQREIVEKLDNVFLEIDSLETNLELCDEKSNEALNSLLTASFTYPTVEIKPDFVIPNQESTVQIVSLKEVVSFEKKQGLFDLPYVGLEDIESDTGVHLGSREPRKVKSNTFAFTSEHLLYGRLRPYLNKALLPNFDGHCSTEIFPIKVSKYILREYLYFWFRLPSTVEAIDATSTGARMPRANMDAVLEFEIPLPSIEKQREIIKNIQSAFAEIELLKQQIKIEKGFVVALRQSLLSSAFTQEEAVA